MGGLCGESKREILDQVTGPEREVLARYTSMVTDASDPSGDLAVAERTITQAGLGYPLVAKPDIGCNGTGVRLVADRAALAALSVRVPPRRPRAAARVRAGGRRGRPVLHPPSRRTARPHHLDHAEVPAFRDRRRTLDAAATDPGRSARRPRPGPVSAAPGEPAGRGAAPGRTRATGVRRQPLQGLDLPQRHQLRHRGADRPRRAIGAGTAGDSGSAASM